MTSKNHISCKKTIVIRNSQTSRNVEIIASDLKISIFLSIELEFKDEQVSYYLESVWISLFFSLCKQLMQVLYIIISLSIIYDKIAYKKSSLI
jgi:hypothetical protein